MFAEGLLLTVAGAAGGTLLAAWGLRLLVAASPAGLPRAAQATLDLRVLGLTLAAALASSLVSGLLPALYAAPRRRTPGRCSAPAGPARAAAPSASARWWWPKSRCR